MRVEFFGGWLTKGQPACFNLPAFFFQQGFMTGILQMHARRYGLPIDTLSFSYKILSYETAAEVDVAPEDGVYIEGFFIVGARFDRPTSLIADSHHKEMHDTLPVFHFMPTQNFVRSKADYECPLYKTSARAGVLSTTGQSTNFVLAVELPTAVPAEHWVLSGTALLCEAPP